MTQANSALSRANGILRAHHLPFRLRAGHNSHWVNVYENLPGRRVRERSVRGCSSNDDQAIEALCFRLVSEARQRPEASLEELLSCPGEDKDQPAVRPALSWPEIIDLLVNEGPGIRLKPLRSCSRELCAAYWPFLQKSHAWRLVFFES